MEVSMRSVRNGYEKMRCELNDAYKKWNVSVLWTLLLALSDLFSNNGDNYAAVLTLYFKSILRRSLFQEDALG
jgi:hypothetical protein